MKTGLATVAVIAGICLAGCAQHQSTDMRGNGPAGATPSTNGDPTVVGTDVGRTGSAGTGGTTVGGGTSTENSGSSAPTGTPK